MAEHLYIIPLLPLIGFLIIGLFGKRLGSERAVGILGAGVIFLAFCSALNVFMKLVAQPAEDRHIVEHVFTWIQAGSFNVELAYRADQLSILFTLIITGVGFLIHVYSIGYMHGDKSFPRFFAYLNLFVFMMLNLVLANNFLVTFLGWEGVGLASYLLIGFWYDQKFPGTNIVWTGDAAKKAFIVNRIGDFGMLVAVFMIYLYSGSLDYDKVSAFFAANAGTVGSGTITIIALSLFLGCTGKSAQIPLAIWLPDAMAGPTPVSALIHAATMVTSGIFLIARTNVIFALSPTAMMVVASVGLATAFLAATIGLVQNDIKKVLAYSTVSQLGFMFIALGMGAFTAGVFHVMTHAFFKALLFLGAGSVIHGMHHEQDIQKMGGLKKYMKTTHITFLLGTLAIAGIFPFAGFFSKDEILWNAYQFGGPQVWALGVIAALCTAFYMFRLYYLTFHGVERFDVHHTHPHESPATMTIPLIVLAILSVLGGFLGVPAALGGHSIPNLLENWLEPVFKQGQEILARPESHEVHSIEYILMGASLCVAIVGILIATRFYKSASDKPAEMMARFKGLYTLLWNKYYLDEFYQKVFVNPIYMISNSFLWKIFDVKIVDGIVNGTARLIEQFAQRLRHLQTGVVQNYAVVMMLGIVMIVGFMAFVH